MNTTAPEYSFDLLFERAISEWPAELELNIIIPNSIISEVYTVKDLGRIADDLGCRHIGRPDEIFMRCLHDSIFSSVHSAAILLNKIRIIDLRKETIKLKLEGKLISAMSNKNLGWDEQDLKLITDYLTVESGK
jgi:hypothetical protein